MENKNNIPAWLIQQKEIIKSFSQVLSAGYDLDKLLALFLNLLADLLKVSRISILLQDGNCFKVNSSWGIPGDIAQRISFPIQEGLIHYLAEQGTAVRIDLIKTTDPLISNQLRALGGNTAVPAWEHGRLKAVIIFNNKITGLPVSDSELEMVFSLGSQLAVAIENAGLMGLISEQRNYLENIISHVNSAVIGADLNGTVTTYNPRAEEILNISNAEVQGKPVDALPHDIAVLIQETIRTGLPVYKKELKLTQPDKMVGVDITAVRDGHKDICGVVMVLTDLTPAKIIAQQKKDSDRLEFVNTVAMRSSHEFKNCLVAIKTFAQLLPQRYEDKQFREDFYLVVNKEVDKLNQVVENLLFFAQPMQISCSPCSIDSLIQSSIDNLDKEELLSGVTVKKQYNHTSPTINVDIDAIKKVWDHLLYNCIQAMPQGGEIQIITGEPVGQEAPFMEFKIIDNGPGIPRPIENKIWEPFFTTRNRGVGLGLTIVRKIIDAHGGRISVTSGNGARGAEVTFRLPLGKQKATNEKIIFPSGRTVII